MTDSPAELARAALSRSGRRSRRQAGRRRGPRGRARRPRRRRTSGRPCHSPWSSTRSAPATRSVPGSSRPASTGADLADRARHRATPAAPPAAGRARRPDRPARPGPSSRRSWLGLRPIREPRHHPVTAAFEPEALRRRPDRGRTGGRRVDAPISASSGRPGRVNLIGEHTDYNEGFVLPAAIDLEIRIAYLPTDDRRVELVRLDDGERDGFDLDEPRPKAGTWLDYVAGTAWALDEAGLPLTGLRGVIASTLPPNAGLSSSAAIELASAWALLDDAAAGVDRFRLAQLCQRAENGYVGVQSGLMDQFAASCGDRRVRRSCSIAGRSTGGRSRSRPTSSSSSATPARRATSRAPSTTCGAASARRPSPPSPRIGPGDPQPARRHARSCSRDAGTGSIRSPTGAPSTSSPRTPACRGDRRRARGRRPRRPSAACSPRATPRCATGSRSAPRSSTRWSRSPSAFPGVDRRPDDRRRVRWLHGQPRPPRRGRGAARGRRRALPGDDRPAAPWSSPVHAADGAGRIG